MSSGAKNAAVEKQNADCVKGLMHSAQIPVRELFQDNFRGYCGEKRGAGGGSRTLTGLLSPADFLTDYGFRRPDAG